MRVSVAGFFVSVFCRKECERREKSKNNLRFFIAHFAFFAANKSDLTGFSPREFWLKIEHFYPDRPLFRHFSHQNFSNLK